MSLIRNQPVTKSIFFKISLPYPRKITFEVKPTNANSLRTDHVGFAIYQADACNLNTSTLIYSNLGIGSYESSNDLAVGTYYVQVFCNNSFDSEVVLNLKKYVDVNQPTNAQIFSLNHAFCIETNNLAEISNPNYPAYTKSFWAKIEIPAGKYAMPLRFRAWNMNTVVKLILRKNSPTAAPIDDKDLLTNYVFQEGFCGLGEGTYYLEVLLKPDALGWLCLQNEATLENTNLIKGTNFSNAIGLENQTAKNIKISCNPIDIPQAVCDGQPNFYLKQSFTTINIPSNGSINYRIWADNAKFQLFSANQTALSSCIDIQNYAKY